MEKYPDDFTDEPRAGLTPEELRAREDNLQPIGKFLPEELEKIRQRMEEDPLATQRRQVIALLNARAQGAPDFDPMELTAAQEKLLALEAEARTQDRSPEP